MFVFLRIWKVCGRASGGLERFSLDLEGSGDLEGFGKVSGDLEKLKKSWKGFLGFGRSSVPLEKIGRASSTLGLVICLTKGAAISPLKDYWLPCHRVDGM